MDPLTALIVTVVGGLVVAGVTGTAAYAFGKRKGVQEYEEHGAANIREYSRNLGDRIREAYATDPADYESFIIRAQAIVAARDDFKRDLDDLSTLLNSSIDELSELVKVRNENRLRENAVRIRRAVGVLHETWGGKEPLIESKLRGMLAKLGIFRRWKTG